MKSIRTRFAPSPTGIMHIGNVRAALLNYLFAQQHNGTFILRIEDTDQERNIDQGTDSITTHLKWLGLTYTEGPKIGGPYGPYFQSERSDIYQKYLEKLQLKNLVYRCFCTPEELEIKRNKQIALKRAPRYERTCLKLSPEQLQQKLDQKTPHIWRMKIDASQKVTVNDLARGTLEFDLQHFSDFPLTREDGSFTFIFANCVDDCEMKISHVFRGEEHLSNTVNQTVLYHAFEISLPIFWHLPILFNQQGKKLSKRDKGFSLDDVMQQGFLPEAICNYLGILGASFEKEILSLQELTQTFNFTHLHGSSQIKYDPEKLLWVNHKWIAGYNPAQLAGLCKPFLSAQYDLSSISDQVLELLIKSIQTDMHTLADSVSMLAFYFKRPTITPGTFNEKLMDILRTSAPTDSWEQFLAHIKPQVKDALITDKDMFVAVRTLLTGSAQGMQINHLFACLGKEEFFARLQGA